MGVNPCWAFGEGAITMEGMASLWGYQQESVEDLKHKLLCTTLELESLRTNATQEMRRSEESINQLIQLLKVTSQERDEARDQLHILLNKITQPTSTDLCPGAPFIEPDSLPVRPARGNSRITESDSLSGTPKHRSFVSSPVESFFDAASSPEQCNVGGVPQQPFYIECNNVNSSMMRIQQGNPKYDDRASAVIDDLAKKKALPEKGKLLQSVMDAGPLLDTLLLAGPLPQWRNPPPLQPYQIPPVADKCLIAQKLNQTAPLLTPNHLAMSLPASNVPSLCVKRPLVMPSEGSSYQSLTAKRQKSQ